jgi:hypothetical protein
VRIRLVEVEPDKYYVLLDEAAIGTLIRRPQSNTGVACQPRWVAFGSFNPADFASKVDAIRHVVAKHADQARLRAA